MREAANRNARVFASTSFLLIFGLAAPEREREGGKERRRGDIRE